MGGKRRKPAVTLAGNPGLEVRPVQVADPFQPHGPKLTVLKNIRTTPADYLHSKGRIDDALKAVADRYQALHDRAEIGGARAIDYSRPKVDGGRLAEPLTQAVADARFELIRVHQELGKVAAVMLRLVIGEGVSIQRVVRDYPSVCAGLSSSRAEGYVTGRVVEALTDLMELWRYEAKGMMRVRTRASHETTTGPSGEKVLDEWGQLVERERPA